MKKIDYLQLKRTETEYEKVKIETAKDAADYIRKFYFDDIEIFESFFILLLDRATQTKAYAKISQGGVHGTVVDIKIVAKYAVDCLASGVILAHNHPSGNLKPSDADRVLTEKVTEGLKLLDVKVVDHIILTKDSYLSFSDLGLL